MHLGRPVVARSLHKRGFAPQLLQSPDTLLAASCLLLSSLIIVSAPCWPCSWDSRGPTQTRAAVLYAQFGASARTCSDLVRTWCACLPNSAPTGHRTCSEDSPQHQLVFSPLPDKMNRFRVEDPLTGGAGASSSTSNPLRTAHLRQRSIPNARNPVFHDQQDLGTAAFTEVGIGAQGHGAFVRQVARTGGKEGRRELTLVACSTDDAGSA
jgi:hypothetical protein